MANPKTLHLEIATPESLIYNRNVQSLMAPGDDGYFGVLPDHSKMIIKLTTGLIEVENEENETETFFIDGGVIEIHGDRATILAESAVDPSTFVNIDVGSEIQLLQTAVNDSKTMEECRANLLLLKKAKAIQAVNDNQPLPIV